jgi:uncharacterized membrane protein YkvA (DUF1232 family)
MTVYFAVRDPRCPWYARAVAAALLAYALSPIDLIPDFIPVLGLLDDLVVVPLGVILVRRLILAEVFEDARRRARGFPDDGVPASRVGGVVILCLWLLITGFAARWAWREWLS